MIALYQKPAKTTKVLVGVFGMSKGQVFCGAGEGFQKRPFLYGRLWHGVYVW
jgi:hypothetical protein